MIDWRGYDQRCGLSLNDCLGLIDLMCPSPRAWSWHVALETYLR